MTDSQSTEIARQSIIAIGNRFWKRGWSLGTSSNYSVVVNRDPLQLLITASGKDKGNLGTEDFVIVDAVGQTCFEGQPKSSAETLLHCAAASKLQAGAILHTHSVWGTLLSDRFAAHHGILIDGFEMLKGLEGISTHETKFWLPIFENTQDIPKLRNEVEQYWESHPGDIHVGFLIRRHGLYAWGVDLARATRHIEVLEFLLECVGRSSHMSSAKSS